MAAIPEKHLPKEDHLSEESAKEKTLDSGSKFMPNVSRKRLLQSIRKEKEHRRRGTAAGVPAQERRMQHQAHLQNHGPALLHHARLAMAHAGGRYPLQHDKERGRRECKIPKKVFMAVRRWVKKEPSDFKFESGSWQLNLLLEMIRERFGLECNARTLRRWLRRNRLSWRKSRHVPYKTASKSVQMEFKQKAGEQACQMRAEGYAVFTEDEAAIQTQQNPNMAGGPRAGGRRARPRFQQDRSGCLAQCQKTGSSSV